MHGLGRGGALVEQRRVGDRQSGQVRHHGLEVEQRLQPALRDFGLIRGVLGVPAGILEDVALDDPGHQALVIAHSQIRAVDLVARGDTAQQIERLPLSQLAVPGQVGQGESALQTDRLRNRLSHQSIQGRHANRLQHPANVGVVRAEMPADERVRRLKNRGDRAGRHRLALAGRTRACPGLRARYASPLFTNSSYCSAFINDFRSAAEENRSFTNQPSECGSSFSSSGSSTTESLISTISPATGV